MAKNQHFHVIDRSLATLLHNERAATPTVQRKQQLRELEDDLDRVLTKIHFLICDCGAGLATEAER